MVLVVNSLVFLACAALGKCELQHTERFLYSVILSSDKESQKLAIGSHHENDKCKWDMNEALTTCAMQAFSVGINISEARRQRVDE